MEDFEKRGYLLENFRLFHLKTQGQEGVDYHYHEFCKLLLLVSGKGHYTVDGRRYRLEPGDAVLIGSRSVHRPELEGDPTYERIILYIDPDFLAREGREDCALTDLFDGSRGHVLRLHSPARQRIFSLAAELEQELSGDGYGRAVMSQALLLRLLVQLGRGLSQSDFRSPDPLPPEHSRIPELMRYMEDHLSEDLDIESLADRFYISKYHMMRLFRAQTGYTVYGYLSHRRLLHARELIRGGMRATEACYRSGFRSYSSFTRAYHKHFGTTPTGREPMDN